MPFSKIQLFGFLALSCSLIACGQPQATPSATSNATPIATSSAIAQTTDAPQAAQTPVAEKTPEPQASSAANGHSLIGSFKEKLESLGIKIALPTYVPQGFWIAAVRTEPCRQGDTVDANGVCRFGPDYAVIYRNSQDHCFTVEATGGGLGGPSSQYTRAVRSKIFDKVDVMIGNGNDKPITDEIANTPQELRTNYAGNSPFYSVRTIKSQAANRINAAIICSDTAHMTPNEFIKIVESLDWLPQSTSSASSAPSQDEAESFHKTFEEINKQPCDDRKSVTEKGKVYGACTANAGGRGQFRFISASEHIAEAPDAGGIVYWYYLNGKVAVITFAHDGRSFMFDQSGKLQAELISAQKVMVNGQEQFQNRSIQTTFTQSERDRLEKLAQEGGKDILSKFN